MFLEGYFDIARSADVLSGRWVNRSTAERFVFESPFGVVSLQRRLSYPQTFATLQGDVLCFGYGNYSRGKAIRQQPLGAVDVQSFLDGEFLYIEANARLRTVVVQRDALSALPLFVGWSGGWLSMANHYPRVVELLRETGLQTHKLTVAECLMRHEHNHRTLIRQIIALYDRMRYEVSPRGPHLTQPSDNPLLVSAITQRRSNPQLFAGLVRQTIGDYAQRYTADRGFVACELSGGIDSSLVAGCAHELGYPVATATINVAGSFGASLNKKVADFGKRFRGSKQYQVSLDPRHHFTHIPLVDAPPAASYQLVELHEKPVIAIIDHFACMGATALFRGLGGDEMFQQSTIEESTREGPGEHRLRHKTPQPQHLGSQFRNFYATALGDLPIVRERAVPCLPDTIISATIGGNNAFIERGVWPVMPLADPRLYAYCQGLSPRYRADKAISRAYMQTFRYPTAISAVAKHDQEHFGHFFNDGAKYHLAPKLKDALQNSVLANIGLLDVPALLDGVRAACKIAWNKDDDILFDAFMILLAESNLQFLEQPR